MKYTIHAAPPRGWTETPCCSKGPLALPIKDRLTHDPSKVTCGKDKK